MELIKKTRYRQYEKTVNRGDMIILLSDGVTECRTYDGFIERETLIGFIKKNMHLQAQEMVNNIFKQLEKMQNFQLRDDFTLIILKIKCLVLFLLGIDIGMKRI